MDNFARAAYAITHMVAIAAFLYSGWWRKLPMLFSAICAGSVIAISYRPESGAWWATWFLFGEPLAVTARLLAVAELLWIQSRHIRNRQNRSLTLASAALFGISAAIAMWHIEPGYPIYTFVQVRRYVQIATAVFMISGVTMIWVLRSWERSLHAAILLALVAKQAMYSLISIRWPWRSMKAWQAADWPGLLVSSLCLLLWSALAVRRRARQNAQFF